MTANITGLGQFLSALAEEPVPYEATESWLQRKDRERLEKKEISDRLATDGLKNCTYAERVEGYVH